MNSIKKTIIVSCALFFLQSVYAMQPGGYGPDVQLPTDKATNSSKLLWAANYDDSAEIISNQIAILYSCGHTYKTKRTQEFNNSWVIKFSAFNTYNNGLKETSKAQGLKSPRFREGLLFY